MGGETKVVDVSTIQKGSYMVIDGEACKVTNVQVSRPGKHGHAKFRIEAVGLIDGKKRDVVMPHQSVEVPIIEKRTAQVLSISG
ncbi:MAG: translation initiation factor IF-5A, partial [Candidatus Woesearchaeota archaeon]